MKVQFLGATETITGSRYLVSEGNLKILVDCGLFQGYKNLRLKNWHAFQVPPAEISAVLLTHAHLDHSGYLPRLRMNGFNGTIFSTPATKDLAAILLPDSGHLQEEEARFLNKHGTSKHAPALPLYTQKDATDTMPSFSTLGWREQKTLKSGDNELTFSFHPAGHLFGAASILISNGKKSIVFSGDLGRDNDPITQAPDFKEGADFVVIESTYGDRVHEQIEPEKVIAETILKTIARKGTVLIPSFAVGRAQQVLYYIHRLKKAGSIPDVPVFLNSPMADKANDVFCSHVEDSRINRSEAHAICDGVRTVASVEESVELNLNKDPKVIIAASGMATGGRVLHHLKSLAPDAKNTILFVGYQAGGTRGDAIVRGAKEIKIHGQYWPVLSEVIQLDTMSAHTDSIGLINWLRGQKKRPMEVFVTHGEASSADNLRRKIEETFPGVRASVPTFGECVNLD